MRLGWLCISALALGACGGDDDDDVLPPLDGETARDFTLRIENVAPWTVLKAGVQPTKTDLVDGPAGPTEAYEIRFTAGVGQAVSFATMFGESNDWFFAPAPEGIPLYTDGVPTSGDVTQYVLLWNAGTEIDQEPAVGDATGPKQAMRNFGAVDTDRTVREVPMTVTLSDGTTFTRPATNTMIKATLTPGPDRGFVLRIENVSTPTTLVTSAGALPIHLSPVVWTVHRLPNPLFEAGVRARDNGLEPLAESGAPDALGTSLRFARGHATAVSPGVFVLSTLGAPLFNTNVRDYGLGLERLAEDGNAVTLHDALVASTPEGITTVGMFDVPVDAAVAGPAGSGQAYEVTFRAAPGDALSFATMFGMSNDWFFATRPEGIALFDGDLARSCDVTSEIALYDLGTELDEELDVGANTGTQQTAPNTGRVDRTTEVREVTIERYEEPAVLHLRVTLRPAPLEPL